MWFKIQNQQVKLTIFAKPNAKKTTIAKIDDQALHILLHAKPHQGEANKELISYLAKLFKLPKSRIILERGELSKHKQVIVPLVDSVQQLLDDPAEFISNHRISV